MKQTYKTKQHVPQEPVKLYKENIHYCMEGECVEQIFVDQGKINIFNNKGYDKTYKRNNK